MKKENKNILMIGPSRAANGGIASVVNQYFTAGLNNKVNLQYLSTTGSGNALKKIAEFCEAILLYPRLLKQADIVHIHMSKSGSFIRKSYFAKRAIKKQKKVIIHMHSSQFMEFYRKTPVLQKRIENVFSKANAVIVLSSYWKEKFSELSETDKIYILENGVQRSGFSREDYEDFNLLFLGKVCEEKGLTNLFEAIRNLKSEMPELKLYIAGEGETERYQKLSSELGIEAHVEFLGWITGEEKENYLKKCSVFVLPSYSEGLPVSLLEAMSYGCACVATSVGSVPEVLISDKNGIMVAPKNTEELQSAIKKCMISVETKRELGNQAIKTIEKVYDIDSICGKLLELYEHCI